VANSDVTFVTKASGVGKKSAERVIVDLADKVGMPTHYEPSVAVEVAPLANDEALEALMALGYTLADATKALEGVDSSLPTAKRVTEALKQ
jgi:holliday junction DNA helicase RuvA